MAHHVISRQRGTSVAFGAKRTSTGRYWGCKPIDNPRLQTIIMTRYEFKILGKP